MNLLLIGGGGREHALAWKLRQSPLLDRLYCAPGNAGIEAVAECVALDVADHAAVIGFCRENDIGLVVIGPEAPLVAGLADDLQAAGVKVFGPSRAAAELEGSKGFTKDLCAEYGIPTAAYRRFDDASAAKAYVATQSLPIVVKADGLAAGKGVVIAETRERRTRRSRIASAARSAPPAPSSSSRSSSTARKRASSRWSTARPLSRSPPHRTTSAPSTATRAPTPAAWAPTRRRRS